MVIDYGLTDIAASGDGSRIAVLSPYGAVGEAFGRFALVVHFPGEAGVRTIPVKRPQPNVKLPSVALSPDGRTVALSIKPSIVLIDLDSGRRRELRHEFLLRPDADPSFTADGTHLVFVHESIHPVDQTDVYETDLDGRGLRRLTDTPTSESYPQLSPDGRHLAFLRKVPGGKGQYEVILASADDSAERVIGRTDYALGGPSFSPDGSQVLFTASKRSDVHEAGPFAIIAADVEGDGRHVVLRSRKGPLIAQWVAGP